jgi:drug/metabolite transporter (DMT)-like permease
MVFAFLTTLLWSLSAVSARKMVDALGSMLANLARLLVATALLTAWALLWGRGVHGQGFWWFVASGVAGFGLGDIALYFALGRIGSRLTILLTQTLAAPVGALVEWLWLGTTLSGWEMLSGAGVLAGVVLALVPKDNTHIAQDRLSAGIAWGVVAAVGQGLGAVLSRRAFNLSAAGGLQIDGGTAAFQRILGGIVVGAIAWWLLRPGPDRQPLSVLAIAVRRPRFVALLLAAALFGTVVGVACYQWALATAPSGIVLPIVALCPIVILPFTYWLEGDRPHPRSLVGGAIAVGCAITLAMVRR